MKKSISLILSVLLIFSTAVLFTSCGETNVRVRSTLEINDAFSGARTLSLVFPGSVSADTLLPKLQRNLPETEGLKIEKSTSDNRENQLAFTISFDSYQQYVERVSALAGREVQVLFSKPDSILLKGVRYSEDFDIEELLSWITGVLKQEEETQTIVYDFESSVLDLDGSLFTTESTANINEVEGHAVAALTIDTANGKDDLYDRQFIFELSESVYNQLGDELKYYFDANTNELAQYSGWTSRGSVYEYQVIFKGLSIELLETVTNQLLDADDGTIAYGDFTNSSTPLSEGLTFEERLNTMSFMGEDKSYLPVTYNYSLPTNTTCGEGSVLKKGSWTAEGKWENSTYSLDTRAGVEKIHIPDGIQYAISGMHFYLDSSGGNQFKRTVDIQYSKSNQEGVDYAYHFFKNKKADVSKEEEKDQYICRVTIEGTALEISEKTVELFGGGNYMDYAYSKHGLDLADSTSFIDYINIGYMLTAENAEKPMHYTVSSAGSEDIHTVNLQTDDGRQKLTDADENGAFTVDFKGGDATVSYSATVADWGKVTLFIIVSSVLTAAAITAVIFMLGKSRKTAGGHPSAPEQTTIFNIKDLGKQKDKK